MYTNYENQPYYLAHYGVLGMKWGIHKAKRNELSSNFKKDKLRRRLLKARKELGTATFKERWNTRKKIRQDYRTDRKAIKQKYKDDKKKYDSSKERLKAYKKKYKTRFDIYRTQKLDKLLMQHALESDPYGTMSMAYIDTGNKYLNDFIAEYSERKLKHSDYLQHYGVLGMKWGVRHDKERAGYAGGEMLSKIINRRKRNIEMQNKAKKRAMLNQDIDYKKINRKIDSITETARQRAMRDKKYRNQIAKATGYADQKWVNDMFSSDTQDAYEVQMDILSDALPALDSEYIRLRQESNNIYKKYMH